MSPLQGFALPNTMFLLPKYCLLRLIFSAYQMDYVEGKAIGLVKERAL
jgi:hypothetical protein